MAIIGLVDIGASVNMIDVDLYDQLNHQKLIKSTYEWCLLLFGQLEVRWLHSGLDQTKIVFVHNVTEEAQFGSYIY